MTSSRRCQGYAGGLLYDGSVIANSSSVVVVVLQYRLGAFGFLHSQASFTGNYGLEDQRYTIYGDFASCAILGACIAVLYEAITSFIPRVSSDFPVSCSYRSMYSGETVYPLPPLRVSTLFSCAMYLFGSVPVSPNTAVFL